MADRVWHIEGTAFAIVDTLTGKYCSHFVDDKFFDEKIIIFDTPKLASEYVSKHGLNKNVFKVVEM